MATKITGKKLAKNLILSLTAQAISIITSFVLGFIVPKFIDEYQYSYWQVYLLYSGYSGICQFGLLDGLVLRYSQYEFDELDKPRMRSQFKLLLFINSALTLTGLIVSAFLCDAVTREIVVLVAASIVVKNIFGYTSYSFQITNRIPKYAVVVIAQRAGYALFVGILLACGVNVFWLYCIADLSGDALGSAIGAFFNRGMYFGRSLPVRECLKEGWSNISAGMILMLSNFSSMLLTGGAKMMVQWGWDELVFGQISFSFSVSNIFLTFVTAISIVLFPSLKRMSMDELPDVYLKLRNAVSPIMFFALLLYFPACLILELWLPNYSDSLTYLGILLPIVVFSAKVALLTNNYLKAYRREKTMLAANAAGVALGVSLFAVGAFVVKDIDFVLYSLVAVVVLNSIVSEIFVSAIIKKRIAADVVAEVIMTIAFILAVRFLGRWWACLAYACAFMVYSLIYRKNLFALFRSAAGLFKKQKDDGRQ